MLSLYEAFIISSNPIVIEIATQSLSEYLEINKSKILTIISCKEEKLKHLHRIFELLSNGNSEMQLQVLEIVLKLTNSFSSLTMNEQMEIINNSPIYKMIFECFLIILLNRIGVQQEILALEICFHLSCNPVFQEILIKKNQPALHLIISSLCSDEIPIKFYSIRILKNLILHSEENRKNLCSRSSLLLGNLFFLTKDKEEEKNINLQALEIIVELATVEENKLKFVQAGILEPLFAMSLLDLPSKSRSLIYNYVHSFNYIVIWTCSLTIFSLSKKSISFIHLQFFFVIGPFHK